MALHEQCFGPGQSIFDLGDTGDAMYVVAEGAVRIYLPIERGHDLLERDLQRIGPGQFFGELALLTHQGLRTASASAIGCTIALSLHRDQFRQLFDDHPAIVAHLLFEQMANRVLNDNLYIAVMSTRSAIERVVRYLLLFGSPSPLSPEGVLAVEVPTPHWQLANMLGLTRESVCRALSELKREELIQVKTHARSRMLITFSAEALRRYLTKRKGQL
jgi:CRP/FNR family transcriptional regulator